MIKVFYCTKEYFQSLGINNIIIGTSPVSLINGSPCMAKIMKWNCKDDLNNSEFIKNTIAMNGLIYLHKFNADYDRVFLEPSGEFNYLHRDDNVKEYQFVDDIDHAEEIWARLYQ